VARRKKTSPFEDLIGVLALLPWWVAVALGVVGYFVLHALARPIALAGTSPVQITEAMTQAVWKGLANVGQYLLPIVCLAAAAMSAAGRRQRQGLLSGVARSNEPDALEGMSWQQFELLVGEAFRLQGYRVVEMGSSGPDGGVDLILHRGREKFLVQCKQWKAFKVGVQVVRELYGVMAARGAAGGFVVTSGRFTDEATAFASGRNVALVDGPKLFELIREANGSLSSAARTSDIVQRPIGSQPNALTQHPVAAASVQLTASGTPTCPTCSRSMVQRTAKRGANAGSAFWGCMGYPACKGTRPLESM